jgi:hypothetical protein
MENLCKFKFLVITLDLDQKNTDPDLDRYSALNAGSGSNGYGSDTLVYCLFLLVPPSLPNEATKMLLKFLVIETVDTDLDRQPKMLDLDQMDTDPKPWFIVYFFISPSPYPRRPRGCWRPGPLHPPD